MVFSWGIAHTDSKEVLDALDAMTSVIRQQFKSVKHLSVQEAQKLQNPIIIDARSNKEISVSVIPKSQPYQSSNQLDRDRPLLIYCTIGYRSSKLAEKLKGEGFQTYNLDGGILNWAHAGGNLLTPKGEPTKRVHTYGSIWNLLPRGYEGVY